MDEFLLDIYCNANRENAFGKEALIIFKWYFR